MEQGVLLLVFIAVIAVIAYSCRFYFRIRNKKKYDLLKITLRDIDQMSGYDFEDYLCVLLRGLGYEETYQTKKSRDYGADVFFIDRLGQKTVVQAKCLADALGMKAVQEAFAAKYYYLAHRAIVITSTDQISASCERLSSATEVKIIGREQLGEIIKQFKKGQLDEAKQILEAPMEMKERSVDENFIFPEKQKGIIKRGEYFLDVRKL